MRASIALGVLLSPLAMAGCGGGQPAWGKATPAEAAEAFLSAWRDARVDDLARLESDAPALQAAWRCYAQALVATEPIASYAIVKTEAPPSAAGLTLFEVRIQGAPITVATFASIQDRTEHALASSGIVDPQALANVHAMSPASGGPAAPEPDEVRLLVAGTGGRFAPGQVVPVERPGPAR